MGGRATAGSRNDPVKVLRWTMMPRSCIVPALVAMIVLTGCAAQSRLLEQKKPTAIEQTVSQARVDLNCPQVTARVISEEAVLDPAPSARYGIEAVGCGKRILYTVTCQEFGEDYKECIISAPGEP
jgi:hypothetical protein